MERALVVVPTYNEVENIGSLLQALEQAYPELSVLVVDDNSPDGTQDIVRRIQAYNPRVSLLARPGKEGLAEAYLAGFDWALAQGFTQVVQMDADFSHHPRYLKDLLAGLAEADVVLGCRYLPGGGTPGWGLLRKVISQGGNLYARAVLGLPYRDLTGGFTAWRAPALRAIGYRRIRSKGYAFQVELKYLSHQAGLRLREVPIVFEDRRYGTSKMSGAIVWEAAIRVLRMGQHRQVPRAEAAAES